MGAHTVRSVPDPPSAPGCLFGTGQRLRVAIWRWAAGLGAGCSCHGMGGGVVSEWGRKKVRKRRIGSFYRVIFLQGVSGLRPLTPPSDGWAALRIAALEMSETLGPTRRYRELFKMQRTVESPCMKLPFLATGAKRGVWGSQGTRACQVVFRGAEAVGDRIS